MTLYSFAITGHRPTGLHDAAGRPLAVQAAVDLFFACAIAQAQAHGAGTLEVVTGGALGIDQALASATVARRAGGGSFKFRSVVVLPFPPEVLGARWPAADLANLRRIVVEADEVVGPLYPDYSVGGLHARNHVMVDRADAVAAFWNGTRSGGTYACLVYALTGGSSKPTSGIAGPRAKPAYDAFNGMRPLGMGDL